MPSPDSPERADGAPSRQCIVKRVPMAHPADVSGILSLLDTGELRAEEIVAVLGKTEGNGCVNDFTRGYAVDTIKNALAPRLDCSPESVEARIALVMSGGTEGGLSPHFIVFAVREGGSQSASAGKRLAAGAASTRVLAPEELGRMAQVKATRTAVAQAMQEAAIDDPADVHYVQIKCPLLTLPRIGEARDRGATVACEDTYESMAFSRGASALGVALALGEIDPDFDETAIANDWSLWSARASTSAGVELMCNEVLVLGNSPAWSGDHAIAHGVMRDAVDLPAVRTVLRDLGMDPGDQLTETDAGRVAAVLTKAEAAREGGIRGLRHTMWDDSDINATRHARAFVGGVLAGAIGHTELFISGGAEHQGPDGGGPVAIIAAAP